MRAELWGAITFIMICFCEARAGKKSAANEKLACFMLLCIKLPNLISLFNNLALDPPELQRADSQTSVLAPFAFAPPARSLSEISRLCFVKDAYDIPITPLEVKMWASAEIDQSLSTSGESMSPIKQDTLFGLAPSLFALWLPILYRCHGRHKRTHGGFTMEKTNKDAHLCPTMDSKPSSPIVIFIIGWNR